MHAELDATDGVVGLALCLRAAGLAVSSGQVQAAVSALALLDPARRDDAYWSGRLTLCSTDRDRAVYDAVFAAYFAGPRVTPPPRPALVPVPTVQLLSNRTDEPDDLTGEGATPPLPISAAASANERLRKQDIATMDDIERAELNRLLAAMRLPGEDRRTRRRRPSSAGPVDVHRTMREWLQSGGEPVLLRRHRPRRAPRRVVLLVDVSGSMGLYAGALLRFAYGAARRDIGARPTTEVFALGTRLTRLTRELATHDPQRALAAAAAATPDAGAGTRLGALLKQFLDEWGQRSLARGAVVVVLSDGWERGDPRLLGAQVARLHRLAHRVIWANPRKAAPGFVPLTAGLVAALPYIDDFVEGHSLAALEHLAEVVRGHRRVHA